MKMKRMNGYAAAVAHYPKIPKAVFAAIAVSALTRGGEDLDEATDEILKEWRILHANGIVPQRPPSAPRVPTTTNPR